MNTSQQSFAQSRRAFLRAAATVVVALFVAPGPAPAAVADASPSTNILYKTGAALSDYERERCVLDVYAPASRTGFPTLVWFHGGGLTGGSKDDGGTKKMARSLAQAGIGVVVPSYRLSPKAKYPAYIEDAAAAVAWTRAHIAEYGGDAGWLFIGGHSAGGYLTLMLGLDAHYLQDLGVAPSAIAGLIPVSGQTMTHYTVREERGLGKCTVTADTAAPVYFARKDTPPMLVLYADHDMPARAEENAYLVALLKWAGNKRVEGLQIADRTHGSIAGRIADEGDPARKAMLEFMNPPGLPARAAPAALEEGFRDVPVADRPWAYWWWLNGHVDRETITRDIEAMRRVGFGGLLMFDARGYWDDQGHLLLPKPKMEFMSPEWRELVTFGIREAARAGLEVSVNLSSCAGALKGPWPVGADAPKRLICQVTPLPGGARADTVLKNPDRAHFWNVATYAVQCDGAAPAGGGEWANAGDGLYTMAATSGKRTDGQQETELRATRATVELTDKVDAQGRLVWDVPPGQWALVRFGYTTIDGHEYDVDVLDAQAVTGHFNRMGRVLLEDVGALAGKTLTHFYSVSWEGAVPTWTGSFEQDFAKYRGYDIRPWLPVLAGFAVKRPEESRRFMSDYRRARNEVFRDHFYGTMMELSHRNGLQWHSESGGPWVRLPAVFGEADQLSFLARNAMQQGEFWHMGNSDRTGRHMSRPQAMAAHTYGRKLAAAEAFTHMVRHWSPYPAILKRSGDESFCDGVNQLVWHTFTCSPREFGLPGSEYFAGTHINPKVTWFEQAAPFVRYLGRCQYLLRQGLFVADVCAYTGDIPYQHWGHFTTNWSATATMTLPRGHGYDLVTTEVLLERLQVRDGNLVLPDGMSYRILAVDLDDDQVSPAALRKIEALRKAGACVVFGKRKPQRTPGLAAGDAEVRSSGERLWAGTPTLAEALQNKGLPPDFEGPFDYTHRRDGATEIYFVAGTGTAECVFRVSGKQPELWNPVSGTIETEVGWQATADGRTRLTLELPQDGSMFVVFRHPGQPRPAVPPPPPTALMSLEGAWKVSFQAGRGAPEQAVFDPLVAWDKHPDSGIKFFSGTATYRKTFALTAEQAAQRVRLQLGTVLCLARVRVNGQDLGVVWTDPWSVELTGALKPGSNELEIEVTNTWVNRLIGDAALPPERRITRSNVTLQAGKRTLKAYQGYASEDPLMTSGLLGPVRLERLP